MADYYLQNPGGNDGNPGTQALPWLTLQHAADTAVAGDRVYLLGSETLAATVDFDTNHGTNGAFIEFIGVGAGWVNDGTRYELDGNNAVVNCISWNRNSIKLENIEIHSATGDGFIATAGNYCLFKRIYSHNNGDAGFNGGNGLQLGILYQCRCNNNTNNGFENMGAMEAVLCEAIGNGSYGFFQIPYYAGTAIGCVAHDNTVSGFRSGAGTPGHFAHCVSDNNGADGIILNSSYCSLIFGCRFTNNTGDGIDANVNSKGIEDYNFFLNNGTAINNLGDLDSTDGNSLAAGVEGYVNAAGDDFSTADNATLRRAGVLVGGPA